jgi:hypothetical protein
VDAVVDAVITTGLARTIRLAVCAEPCGNLP